MKPTQRNKNPGCLSIILSIFRKQKPKTLPYKLRENILSPAEISFFKVLQNITQGKFEIECKIRLADIFYTPYGTNISYFNRIAEKHIDFLLCETMTMKPILGIELDDLSHQKPNRQKRDAFIENLFKTAKLPLLRIPVKRTYNQEEILIEIKEALK